MKMNAREQQRYLAEAERPRASRMKWWQDARFGMFIHWGLYAQLARHEWVMNRERIPIAEYEKLDAMALSALMQPLRAMTQQERRQYLEKLLQTLPDVPTFKQWLDKTGEIPPELSSPECQAVGVASSPPGSGASGEG